MVDWRIPVRGAGLTNDLRYAVRILARQPSFSILATLTMALGIGVMTTLFSVTYNVLLRPLPWSEPDRLIRLTETHPGATRTMRLTMTNMSYLPWRDLSTTVDDLAAWSRRNVTITGTGEAERLLVSSNSASLFSLLRAKPYLGTVFTADDDRANAPVSKVVLSFGLWQQRFGGRPGVLGQTLQLDGKPYTVVGVMPRDFFFPDRDVRAWLPMSIPPLIGSDGRARNLSMFSAMARLKPGVTVAQAAAEATARARTAPDPGEVGIAVFGINTPAEIQAVPALEALTSDVRPALVSLLFAVALLLVTAIANVASLQLARASSRRREMAIRAAIGAGTQRIAQQLLIEGLLLGSAGGVLGLIFSGALHAILPAALPADFPRLDNLDLAWIVVLFAVVLTFLTGLLLGIIPALNLRRVGLAETLMENGTASAGARRTWYPSARTMIMTGQVAIACTLLIGATLLARSFLAMMHADRGFDVSNVLTARVGMPDFAFTPQRRLQVFDTFLDRVRSLTATAHIGYTTGLPLINSETISGFTMKSLRPPRGSEVQVNTVRSVVTDDYFAAIGMRIVEGRGFSVRDTASSPKVVVVNRTFAKRYLTDTAIGDRISNFAENDNMDFEVVGIVDDVLKHSVSDPPQPELYSLNRQMTSRTFNPNMGSLVIRTSGDPRAFVEPLRQILHEQDPSLTFESIVTMDDRLSTSLARPRLYATLLGTFALSALVIASVGLFGLLSYAVAQRKREIAIRSALGATPAKVVGLILGQALSVTLAGLFTGIVLSLAVIGYLATLLYGVTVHDALSFVAVPLFIIGIASVASLVPAIRASRIDPMTTMRSV